MKEKIVIILTILFFIILQDTFADSQQSHELRPAPKTMFSLTAKK